MATRRNRTSFEGRVEIGVDRFQLLQDAMQTGRKCARVRLAGLGDLFIRLAMEEPSCEEVLIFDGKRSNRGSQSAERLVGFGDGSRGRRWPRQRRLTGRSPLDGPSPKQRHAFVAGDLEEPSPLVLPDRWLLDRLSEHRLDDILRRNRIPQQPSRERLQRGGVLPMPLGDTNPLMLPPLRRCNAGCSLGVRRHGGSTLPRTRSGIGGPGNGLRFCSDMDVREPESDRSRRNPSPKGSRTRLAFVSR